MTARVRLGERGYIGVAALLAAACFGVLALAVIANGRSIVTGVGAHVTRARLEAAADAGFALTVRDLGSPGWSATWRIDGTPRRLPFDDTLLTVRVEDERGKIPVNYIEEQQTRAMFQAAGARGAQLDTLTDSFLDWRDEDDDRRSNGAEAADYKTRGIVPANTAFTSLEELALINGMSAEIYARIAPAISLYTGNAPFSGRTASPLAVTVMMGGPGSAEDIERLRELRGQRTALDTEAEPDLRARALTVRVTAESPNGGRFTRATIVELTGRPARPFLIRSVD